MAQTWISVFWVAIPLLTLPLLWPSALRIWVSLAKSMPMPPWPHHPSRRKTKSPHITNKNTNNLEKSPIQPTTIFNFIIPKTLYVNRIVPIKIEQKISGMQIHHHENQNHLEQKVWTNFNFETSTWSRPTTQSPTYLEHFFFSVLSQFDLHSSVSLSFLLSFILQSALFSHLQVSKKRRL